MCVVSGCPVYSPCLQPDTRNSFGISENVFRKTTFTERTTCSFLWKFDKYGISTMPASISEKKKTCRASEGNGEKHTIFQYLHRDLQGRFSTCNPPSHAKGAYPHLAWLNSRGIKSQECISINSLILPRSNVEKRVSRPRYVRVQASQRTQCCGSKKWRWSNQWTILRRRSQLQGTDSRIFGCVMQRSRPR